MLPTVAKISFSVKHAHELPPMVGPVGQLPRPDTMYGLFEVTFRVEANQKSRELTHDVWRPVDDVGYDGFVTQEVRDSIIAEAWTHVRGSAARWAEYVSNVCPIGCQIDCETGCLC